MRWDGTRGLNTMTLKNVLTKWPPQNPSAAMHASDNSHLSLMVGAWLPHGCRAGLNDRNVVAYFGLQLSGKGVVA